jgi:anti-sigma factor RsiW
MTDPQAPYGQPEHADFEALAAGYALHALEPEDEQRLSAHLVTCPECARLVADTASLGAAFTDLLEPETPPPGLRERILAAATAEPRAPGLVVSTPPAPTGVATEPVGPAVPTAPQSLPGPRRRVRERIAVAVLAAAVGVGVAVPVTLAASHHNSAPAGNAALAQWLLEPNAREVTLKAASGSGLAKAVIASQGVYLLADRLRVNDASTSIYVLWAADAQGQRRAVATFDVRNGAPVQLTAGKLPYSTAQIRQLAISYEPGRKAPAQPSDVVLTGTA